MTKRRQPWKLNPKVKLAIYALPMGLLTIALLISGLTISQNISHQINLRARFLPPGDRFSDGRIALLGTDHLGRDLLSQICVGAPISIFVGVTSVLIASAVGTLIGLTSGYLGGWKDVLMMRVVDMQLGFPPLLLAIVLGGVLGPSLGNVVIALSVIRWATFARLARSLSVQLRDQAYVEAAKAVGGSYLWIIMKHILPSAIGPIIVVATSLIGMQILAEAALSFVGFGVVRPLISWGSLINEGGQYLASAWWGATFPGVTLMLYVFSVSWFGDALQDYMGRRIKL